MVVVIDGKPHATNPNDNELKMGNRHLFVLFLFNFCGKSSLVNEYFYCERSFT